MNKPGEARPQDPNGGPKKSSRAGARLAEVDEVEVVVEKLVAGGEGLARWQGIPIFVPRSAPGDRVRVKIVERRPDYGRAEILEVLIAGPGRREPPCAHFGRCGGCDLQHLEDTLQSELKAAATLETLSRLGGIRADFPVEIIRGDAWAYRQRAQVHIARSEGGLRVGFHARQSLDIVAVDSCPVLVPELEQKLSSMADFLPTSPPKRVDMVVGDGGTLSSAPRTPQLPHGDIQISVGSMIFELDARCFFQAHRQLMSQLVRQVVGSWQGDLACDLYAGVGLFSVPLAESYDRVVAVEGDAVSGRFLKRNARKNRKPNLELVPSAVESWIRDMPEGTDRVVVDPPRTGLSRQTCAVLRDRSPRRLTYVSCHAAALARDLKLLAPKYGIESLTLLDLFPQTGHMEVVAQLVCR